MGAQRQRAQPDHRPADPNCRGAAGNYQPGTKFDQIVVLEGIEGRGKSTAIEILAGQRKFLRSKILGSTDRQQQEAMSGVWLYEIAS